MYKLTQTTYNALITLGLEGKNDIKVFDSSEKGFVIGLGMTKDEAIRAGILEEVAPNILYHLSSTNNCIPHEWIKKNLSEDQYHSFLCFMEGQGQSEYGCWATDVKKFLTIKGI